MTNSDEYSENISPFSAQFGRKFIVFGQARYCGIGTVQEFAHSWLLVCANDCNLNPHPQLNPLNVLGIDATLMKQQT
jgi:hypothetical protein